MQNIKTLYILFTLISSCSTHTHSDTVWIDTKYESAKKPFQIDLEWNKAKNSEQLTLLIQKGINLNPKHGLSPLLYAPTYEMKEILLKFGANPNHIPSLKNNATFDENFSFTNYHPMIGIKSTNEAKLLMQYGGKIPIDIFTVTFKHEIEKNEKYKLYDFFISHGANFQGKNYSVQNGYKVYENHFLSDLRYSNYITTKRLKIFKSRGLDLEGIQISTPILFLMCYENQINMIKAGTQPNIQSPNTGDTVLIYNLKKQQSLFYPDFNTTRFRNFIKKLIKLGVDPTIKNKDGRTAISYATHDRKLVTILLELGADPSELIRLGPAPAETLENGRGIQTFRD